MRFLALGAVILIVGGNLEAGRATLVAADKEKLGSAKSAKGPAGGDSAGPDFDPDRAFGYLTRICDIGSRISGSDGMEQQQQLIAEHFAKLKAQVKFQSFDAPHPQTRTPVRMSNMIVSWDPEATERVLLACHYDTRPHADRDANPKLARDEHE